jgi:hypothetical protein
MGNEIRTRAPFGLNILLEAGLNSTPTMQIDHAAVAPANTQ